MRRSYNSLTTHATCVCAYARGLRQSNVSCLCTRKLDFLQCRSTALKLVETLAMPQQLPKHQINSNQDSVSVHKISRQSPAATSTESRHTSCMKWMQDKLQTNENMEKLQRAAYTCATEKPWLASLKQQHGASKTNQASKIYSDHWEQHHS